MSVLPGNKATSKLPTETLSVPYLPRPFMTSKPTGTASPSVPRHRDRSQRGLNLFILQSCLRCTPSHLSLENAHSTVQLRDNPSDHRRIISESSCNRLILPLRVSGI